MIEDLDPEYEGDISAKTYMMLPLQRISLSTFQASHALPFTISSNLNLSIAFPNIQHRQFKTATNTLGILGYDAQ